MAVNETRTTHVQKVQLEDAGGDELVINSDGSINTTPTPPTGTSATQIQGTATDGAAAVGKPVQIGGVDGSANAQSLLVDTSGRPQVVGAAAVGAAIAGNPLLMGGSDGTNARAALLDTSGRQQVVGAAAAGATAAGAPVLEGGVYTTNANQPAVTTGQVSNLQTDPAGNLRTAPQRPTATDILAGYVQHTSTTADATVITVPAGRTFVGRVAVSVAASKAAAATGNGLVSALIKTAGTNVVPAAGTYFAVSARIGANAATGVVGTQGSNFGSMPITVVAPAGNSVTVTLSSTLTSTTEGAVDCSIWGVLQ